MKFSETASNGTCPTCGREIDWGQEYCNNCRPPIDEIKFSETNESHKFYCNYCDKDWYSSTYDIYCPECGRHGTCLDPLD